MTESRTLVLYDGDCGFCRWCVGWARRRDVHGRLEFVPYQECPSPPMTADLAAACERALHVIRPDAVVARAGRATLEILDVLGHPKVAQILARRPLIWAVEAGYRVVAANRHHLGRFFSVAV